MSVQAVNAGVENIHYLQLDTANYDNFYDWCDGHPSAVADLVIAEQLSTFIQAVMPSWSNTSAISSTVDQATPPPQHPLASQTWALLYYWIHLSVGGSFGRFRQGVITRV